MDKFELCIKNTHEMLTFYPETFLYKTLAVTAVT